ncbi:MAG: hypothetical protein ACLQVK_23525 [Acidimicrobiales bacterium]
MPSYGQTPRNKWSPAGEMAGGADEEVDIRAVKAALSAAVLWSIMLSGSPAFAAATLSVPVGGPVRVFVAPGSGNGGRIFIAGAIGDYGKTLNINKNGTADPNGNYVKVILQKGTFEVNNTALNTKMANAQPVVNNPKTCSGVISGTAPVTLFDGTGLYAGISGTVTISITQVFIFPFYAAGKHKGQCNEGNSAQPVATNVSATGSGTVSFSM